MSEALERRLEVISDSSVAGAERHGVLEIIPIGENRVTCVVHYGANQERTNAEFDAGVIGCSDLEVCAVAMLQHLIRKYG